MYYDIHVFHDRKNSFSIPFESTSTDKQEIVKDAVFSGHIDREDAKAVNNVTEISKEEYEKLKNA